MRRFCETRSLVSQGDGRVATRACKVGVSSWLEPRRGEIRMRDCSSFLELCDQKQSWEVHLDNTPLSDNPTADSQTRCLSCTCQSGNSLTPRPSFAYPASFSRSYLQWHRKPCLPLQCNWFFMNNETRYSQDDGDTEDWLDARRISREFRLQKAISRLFVLVDFLGARFLLSALRSLEKKEMENLTFKPSWISALRLSVAVVDCLPLSRPYIFDEVRLQQVYYFERQFPFLVYLFFTW